MGTSKSNPEEKVKERRIRTSRSSTPVVVSHWISPKNFERQLRQ
ncbi:MAG: hypothetical protein ABSG32_25195 [Terriglobia bacterium]